MTADCCRCNPDLCESDDTGQHCEEQACGYCLHGCPAENDDDCCGGTTALYLTIQPAPAHL
ncbi:hypothetical protein AB0I61_17205 [Polymorphospora rubra]|uniref:hypothetical protein n=1 Tax=Polymorphospora rubra TaxID=338584 RepID=UPI0034068A7A